MNLDEAIPTDISWFREWRSPRDFSARVSDIIDCLRQREALPNGRHELFAAHKWRYLLEAWAAGNLSYILAQRGPLRVRLGEGGQKPDFYIQQHANVMPFELTECDDDQRRRGDEYLRMKAQNLCRRIQHRDVGHDNFILRKRLPECVRKKLIKCYQPPRHLCIYINIGWKACFPLHELAELTSCGKDVFRSIWLLWSESAIQTWPRLKCVSAYQQRA